MRYNDIIYYADDIIPETVPWVEGATVRNGWE